MIRSSFKQMLRTPVKTALFLTLLSLSAVMLSLGVNLWRICAVGLDAYENTFMTIGTVQQKQATTVISSIYDADTKDYTDYIVPTYNAPILKSALDFDGANYVLPPEKRPTYLAYLPEYVLWDPIRDPNFIAGHKSDILILEIEPIEDCVPAGPVKVNIMRVLYGTLPDYIKTIWICDHRNPEPEKLFAGKTYIMGVGKGIPHSDNPTAFTEYVPYLEIQTVQFGKNGARFKDSLVADTDPPWDEVADGFYNTERGERWLDLVKAKEYILRMIPVTPTQNTILLLPFYNGSASVIVGRDINEQEYRNGDKVCLVPEIFAKSNDLTVGSTLRLPLLYADYYGWTKLAFSSFSAGFGGAYLNAEGKAYEPFANGEYTVVGIYTTMGSGSRYDMVRNEVVIPSASVKNSDENNIISYGPMMGYTTSFQIPNGDIERYMALWDAQGIDDIEIQFYDRGYTELKAGMDNMRSMSRILLVTGIITTLLILLYFCDLFITKQRKRTAIERSLGVSKARCTLSLISGLIAIVITGAIVGSIMGWLLTGIAAKNMGHEIYSTEYSNWAIHSGNAGEIVSVSVSGETSIRVSLLTGSAVVFVSLLIASICILANLRSEPLKLLSSRE